MSQSRAKFSVFTKPWKMPLPQLGRFVADLGFEGVELPVRPGYQVEPERVEELPEAARILGEFGINIEAVTGSTATPDERTIEACAQAGVPVFRICVDVGPEGYLAMERQRRREFDALAPVLERYGVTLGLQNHSNRFVGSAIGIRRLIEDYDPRQVAAVYDPAHCALEGEAPPLAVEILWSHLRMVFLKNAYRRRVNGPEAEVAQWQMHWTTGRHGLASWPLVAEELTKRDWQGVVCLCAEYTDHEAVNRLIAEDLAFARPLFVRD